MICFVLEQFLVPFQGKSAPLRSRLGLVKGQHDQRRRSVHTANIKIRARYIFCKYFLIKMSHPSSVVVVFCHKCHTCNDEYHQHKRKSGSDMPVAVLFKGLLDHVSDQENLAASQ